MIRKFLITLIFMTVSNFSAPYIGVSVGKTYFPSLLVGIESEKISLGADISWWFTSMPGGQNMRENEFSINPGIEGRFLMYDNDLKFYSILNAGTEFGSHNEFFILAGLGAGIEKYLTDYLALVGQYSICFSARGSKETAWSIFQSPSIKIIYCFGKKHF